LKCNNEEDIKKWGIKLSEENEWKENQLILMEKLILDKFIRNKKL
jgi:hypothetical protein